MLLTLANPSQDTVKARDNYDVAMHGSGTANATPIYLNASIIPWFLVLN